MNGRERAAPAQLTHVRSRERTSLDSLSAEFVVSKLTQRDLLDNKVGVFCFYLQKEGFDAIVELMGGRRDM